VLDSFEGQEADQNVPVRSSDMDVAGDEVEDNSEEPELESVNEDGARGVTDPNGINYRLYGIVEHGGSLNWGHYVAYVRVDSDWYYISDSSVSSSNISTVLARDPYILFYERVV